MEIKLYSTHCPQCMVLTNKLKEKNIRFEEITDIEEMEKLNIMSVPVLSVEGNLMVFPEAVRWVNQQESRC